MIVYFEIRHFKTCNLASNFTKYNVDCFGTDCFTQSKPTIPQCHAFARPTKGQQFLRTAVSKEIDVSARVNKYLHSQKLPVVVVQIGNEYND